MKGDDADKWQDAVNAEYNTLLQHGTWELVELPPGEKAIGSGWVFKVKRNADGSIERYKARLVAKGYSQHPGIDYNKVFAPMFRPATLCLILALAAMEDKVNVGQGKVRSNHIRVRSGQVGIRFIGVRLGQIKSGQGWIGLGSLGFSGRVWGP